MIWPLVRKYRHKRMLLCANCHHYTVRPGKDAPVALDNVYTCIACDAKLKTLAKLRRLLATL